MSEFLGVEVEIPFTVAAGTINGPNLERVIDLTRQVLRSPLPFSRWGSITYNGGEGNEPLNGRVYYHNQLTGQTVNSMGLPCVSIKTMEQVYPEVEKEAEDRGKFVLPCVSGGKGEDPVAILPEMVERLVEAGAKRVEVNYSCPNKFVEGAQLEPVLSHDLDNMIETDEAIIRRVGLGIWIVRKIAPLVGGKQELITPTAQYFGQAPGLVAISFNTVGGQSILTELGEPALDVPGNVAGLSGRATKLIGRKMLANFQDILGKDSKVQIDSPLGVDSGQEVHLRADEMGANMTSGTTIFWENEKTGLNYERTGRQIADQYYEAKVAAIH